MNSGIDAAISDFRLYNRLLTAQEIYYVSVSNTLYPSNKFNKQNNNKFYN
jgi:hypothetical protein